MRLKPLLLLGLLLFASACNPSAASPPVTETPLPTPTPTVTTAAPTVAEDPTFTPPTLEVVNTTAPQTPVAPGGGPGWQAQVELADGRCCVGGTLGSQVDLPVSFSAVGPGGPAVGMRYRPGSFCGRGSELPDAAWQPFSPAVSIPLSISAINWVGFYISAQFRDAQGNISEVVCDDISVEGAPAPPTP